MAEPSAVRRALAKELKMKPSPLPAS